MKFNSKLILLIAAAPVFASGADVPTQFIGSYELKERLESDSCPRELVVQYATEYSNLKVHRTGAGYDSRGPDTENFYLDKLGEKQSQSYGGFMGAKTVFKYKKTKDSFVFYKSEKRVGYMTPIVFVGLRKYSEIKLAEDGIKILKTIEEGYHEDHMEYSYESCDYKRMDSDWERFVSYWGDPSL